MRNCIAIISGAPLNLAPYIQYHINLLQENKVEFIILNVESDKGDKMLDNQIIFDHPYKKGLFNKINRIIKGLKYVHSNTKKFNCEKIIIAPTRTGIRLFPYLYLFFKNKYILDIRDFTKEDKFIFKYIENKVIENSYLTLISSKGFYSFIDKSDKVVNIHNLPAKYTLEKYPKKINRSDIVIGSVGMTAYFKENNALIRKLANHPEIQLHYYGIITDEWNIDEYLRENVQIKNMHFFGKFKNEEKKSLYKKITFINNIYGCDSINARTLTANRLYDAAIYKIPIIVSKGTYLSQIVEEYGLGFSIDVFNDDVNLEINNFIDNFKIEEFNRNCEKFMNFIVQEQNHVNKMLIDFFTED